MWVADFPLMFGWAPWLPPDVWLSPLTPPWFLVEPPDSPLMFSRAPKIGGSWECNDVTWPQLKANSLQGVINLFSKEPNSIIYRNEPDVETHCNGRQDEEISKKLCPYHNATQLQSAFAISSFTLFNWSCLWILSKRLIFCLLTRYSCIG